VVTQFALVDAAERRKREGLGAPARQPRVVFEPRQEPGRNLALRERLVGCEPADRTDVVPGGDHRMSVEILNPAHAPFCGRTIKLSSRAFLALPRNLAMPGPVCLSGWFGDAPLTDCKHFGSHGD